MGTSTNQVTEKLYYPRKNCSRKQLKSHWEDPACPLWSQIIYFSEITGGFEGMAGKVLLRIQGRALISPVQRCQSLFHKEYNCRHTLPARIQAKSWPLSLKYMGLKYQDNTVTTEFVPQQILSKALWKTAARGKSICERSIHQLLWDHTWKEPVTHSPDIPEEFTL